MYGAVKILLVVAGGLLFAGGLGGYFYVRIRLKPRWEQIEGIYWEFEEEHPVLRRYHRGLRLTLTMIFLSMLFLFLALVL
jgi:hypothetical protein